MKILFLLDGTNDKSEITVPNGRALEVFPHQLQLRQTGPCETWLAFPVDERGYNPDSNSHVPLVKFPVALKTPDTGSRVQQTQAETPLVPGSSPRARSQRRRASRPPQSNDSQQLRGS